MNKFKVAAVLVLKKIGQPMHYKEITRIAMEDGILETEGITPEATMNSQIILDIRNKKEASDFIKVAPSTYGINPSKKEVIADEKIKDIEREEEEKIAVETGFTGKGGEFLVCGELLLRGFNASIMSVDVGMDIVATKDNQLYAVQVKTSNLNATGDYNFDIRKVSFDRHSTGNVYYVFVLRETSKLNYLILPFSEVEKKVAQGAILSILEGRKLRIRITIRDGYVYIGNRDHEVNYYLNNWGLMK